MADFDPLPREVLEPAQTEPLFARAEADDPQRAQNIDPGLGAIMALTDGVGIFRHSVGVVPDRKHGYSTDDNVRALLLMFRAAHVSWSDCLPLAMTYASFVQHAWNDDCRTFRDVMSFDRRWSEIAVSHDRNGRVAWVMGELVASAADDQWRGWAREWYAKALRAVSDSEEVRAVAFAMLGAASVLRAGEEAGTTRGFLERGGDFLMRLLDSARRPDWAWFEAMMGHDNPRLPQALLEAGATLDRPEWTEAALDTLGWIGRMQQADEGHFRPVGSHSAGRAYQVLPFDQQPLEAWAAIDAAASAHAVTRDARWLKHADIAWRWFLGENDGGVALADVASGRCHDALTPNGANGNMGAESMLSFQLARCTMVLLQGAEPIKDAIKPPAPAGRGQPAKKADETKKTASSIENLSRDSPAVAPARA